MQKDGGLVLNLPGGIMRLPLHAGALKAWYDLGFIQPDTICCTSAGAMAASIFAGWDDKTFFHGMAEIGQLTPNRIFSIQHRLKVEIGALGAVSLGVGLLLLLGDHLTRGKRLALGVAGLGALIASEGAVGRELVHSESLFSIDPLLNLLEDKLDFRAIFNSQIQLEVLAADMENPREVIFRNRDYTDTPVNRKRWLDILRATSRLPGKFPFITVEGVNAVDGEVWTDFPIRQMKEYRKIVRLDYWPPLTAEKAPKDWISDLTRSFDIMRDRCTVKKMANYEYERQANSDLPEVFYFRLGQELESSMPKIHIHNFTPKDMRELMAIGYRAVVDQEMEIARYLSR